MNEKRKNWTRDELILAINLYCKTPFGKIHIRNPDIIRLAELLGRTPGSVSYKLANFSSIDPTIDRKGAENVSKLDKAVWAEFFTDWESLISESEQAIQRIQFESDHDAVIKEGKEMEVTTKARTNQHVFRKMILASYEHQCCITGLCIPEVLRASHIVAWADDAKNRLNPMNGLCLSATYDAAFDRHLIALSDDYRIMLSPALKHYHSDDAFKEHFAALEGKQINLPKRFLPSKSLLAQHRSRMGL